MVTALWLSRRRNTPGVNSISALPSSVVRVCPSCNSAEPIDFEVRFSAPIDACPSTSLRVPVSAVFAPRVSPHIGTDKTTARKSPANALIHDSLIFMFLDTLDEGGTAIDAARTAFGTREMPPPAAAREFSRGKKAGNQITIRRNTIGEPPRIIYSSTRCSAWRLKYQQGGKPGCGNRVRAQARFSSLSKTYSTRFAFS